MGRKLRTFKAGNVRGVSLAACSLAEKEIISPRFHAELLLRLSKSIGEQEKLKGGRETAERIPISKCEKRRGNEFEIANVHLSQFRSGEK